MPAEPGRVEGVDPNAAWDILASDPDTALVDVRTRAEWTFVGLPDLGSIGRPVLTVEWVRFPDMAPNPEFTGELGARLGGACPGRLLFLCRSGQRSRLAAERVAADFGAAGLPVHCINIEEGFEGDRDAFGRRGATNGWKARGLPWTQS